MLGPDPRESLWREARFETFEERLVLSAQPVGDLVIDSLESSQMPIDYQEVAPALADSNQASGVNYAHESFGFSGKGQTVAVIDTGIAYDHTSLGGGFGSGARVIGGWDFAENDADPYDDGPFGFHGTHVAGIIGSDHDYHTGVAPEADLVALRVFDDLGYGEMEWVEEALQWVIQNRVEFNITTVNLSIGTTWNADTVPEWATLEDEFQQLENAGVFLSVAAGNSFEEYNTAGVSYPAASEFVVPVASHDSKNEMSDFSQRNDRVIVAPGEQITSAIPSHVFGGSGPSSYFMGVSGTSMAAPYVAGASVIMREAMDFAGYENVTQDAIYDYFFDTADLIYDPITDANYHQLNLESALDALLADEYGSDAASAHDLGTLIGDESIAGMIGRLDDVDFFTFTAAETGTITFESDVTHDMVSDWQLVGGGGSKSDGALSFDVQAGESYTLSLESSGGLGHYEIGVAIETASTPPTPVDWGAVSAASHLGENITGDAWYQFTATRDGIFTVESLFSHASGNVDIDLYDANGQLVASSNSLYDNERIDVTVASGDAFSLNVRGTNSDVDFRLTNLVAVNGDVVDIYGTAGNDNFSFAGGSVHQLSVNGVEYEFDDATTLIMNIHGEGGNDQATLFGTADREVATMRVGSADFEGITYLVTTESIENVTVHGGGGGDWARFYDSSGDDVFTGQTSGATLTGSGFSNTANGFDRIYAHSTGGGDDRANLFDSLGADRFYAHPDHSILRGDEFYNYVEGFESVFAYATSGGDQAWMYDSAGNEQVVSDPNHSEMSGDGFYNYVQGFGETLVYANGGGDDSLQISDSVQSNQFIVSTTDVTIENDRPFQWAKPASIARKQLLMNSDNASFVRFSNALDHAFSRIGVAEAVSLDGDILQRLLEGEHDDEFGFEGRRSRESDDGDHPAELRAVDAIFDSVGKK